jgi:chemotaxis protein MotB
MLQKLKDETGSDLKVEEDVNKVTIEMNEKILFASGSAKLNMQSENTLRKLAESLNKVEGDVIVQGHTDNIPIRTGRFDSNWELSTARAFSVIEKLTEVGVPAKRLAAWGFGENRPLVSNETAEGQAQNRRIEVVVLKAKAS